MKKTFPIFAVLLLIFATLSCSKKTDDEDSASPKPYAKAEKLLVKAEEELINLLGGDQSAYKRIFEYLDEADYEARVYAEKNGYTDIARMPEKVRKVHAVLEQRYRQIGREARQYMKDNKLESKMGIKEEKAWEEEKVLGMPLAAPSQPQTAQPVSTASDNTVKEKITKDLVTPDAPSAAAAVLETIEKAKEVVPDPDPVPPKEENSRETYVEVKPSFKGGDNALYTWLEKNIQYPAQALEQGISGKVVVTFKVEKDGTITNVKVSQGKHWALDAEAVRLVRAMPKWNPGYYNGELAAVEYTLPITFSLQD